MHIAVAAKTAITHISTSHDEYTDNSIYCLQRFQLDAYVCTLYSSSIQSNLGVQFIGKRQTSHS